jgi:hypothetical protein
MSKRRCPVWLVAAALLAGPLGCAHLKRPPSELADLPAGGPLLSERAPVFDGTAINGQGPFSSKSGNRAMVIYFFRSDSEDEIVVVAISRDPEAATARSLAAEYDLTYPVLHDGSGALARMFSVSQATAVFVVSGYGQVEWSAQGEQPQQLIGRAADSVMAGSTRAVATK